MNVKTEVKTNLKAVDFFCGAGGMSCGFSKEGVFILGGIDIEAQFRETYLANHEGAKFINRDIIRYQPNELQEELGLKKFDDNLIFIGCSPCQYWSKISTIRHRSSYSGNLIYDFQRFIKYFRPGFVVVENVPGIINKKNNHVFLEFLDFLLFHGYKYEHRIIRTDEYGVPQRRKRFVLIGSRINDEIIFPESEENQHLTVRRFIGEDNGFPKLEDGNKDEADFMNFTSKLSPHNKRRLQVTPNDGGTRMAWKDNPKLQIPAYEGKNDSFRSVYGRMYWDRPAPTITTRFIAISCGRFAHPEEDRGLSLKEGATLQTFPKDYKFKGSMVSIAKQIGNAVPPELARRIAESIKKMKKQ
jgi:DNA (cytosine-5)-methyltransferase 1